MKISCPIQLRKKKKQYSQLFIDQACALVFRARFLRGFFITFLGRFLYNGKTVEKFVNKQLALANWVKKDRVAAMTHGNYGNYVTSAAWKLSDNQIKSK